MLRHRHYMALEDDMMIYLKGEAVPYTDYLSKLLERRLTRYQDHITVIPTTHQMIYHCGRPGCPCRCVIDEFGQPRPPGFMDRQNKTGPEPESSEPIQDT